MVSLMDQSKTVGPTCPTGGPGGSRGTAKTATTHGHWEVEIGSAQWLVAIVEIQAPLEVKGRAACGCNTGALIPTLQCIWCQFAAVCFVQDAIPSLAPVLYSIHPLVPSTFLAQIVNPSIHHTRLPNCAKGRPARLPLLFVCCLAVSTNRNPTVHAGGIQHTPSQQIVVCWHLNTRSWIHRQLHRSDMPFDDVY